MNREKAGRLWIQTIFIALKMGRFNRTLNYKGGFTKYLLLCFENLKAFIDPYFNHLQNNNERDSCEFQRNLQISD